jgi:transposase
MSLFIPCKNIWVSQQPIDFRRSVDGLCAYIQETFREKAQEGLYVFYNSARNRLKLLLWHYNGFLLIYKRKERGRFPFQFSSEAGKQLLTDKQLEGLLLGFDWPSITHWEGVRFENYF